MRLIYFKTELNFLFQFDIIFIIDLNIKDKIIIYVINANIAVMHIYNIINKALQLSKHIKLNKIINFKEKDYYYLNILIIKIN